MNSKGSDQTVQMHRLVLSRLLFCHAHPSCLLFKFSDVNFDVCFPGNLP